MIVVFEANHNDPLFADVSRAYGQVTWIHGEHDKYLVTGRDTKGRRVRVVSGNFHYANGINCEHRRIWLLRAGRRTLLQE